MPAQYTAIKNRMLAAGESAKNAKSRAAAIYMKVSKSESGKKELLADALRARLAKHHKGGS